MERTSTGLFSCRSALQWSDWENQCLPLSLIPLLPLYKQLRSVFHFNHGRCPETSICSKFPDRKFSIWIPMPANSLTRVSLKSKSSHVEKELKIILYLFVVSSIPFSLQQPSSHIKSSDQGDNHPIIATSLCTTPQLHAPILGIFFSSPAPYPAPSLCPSISSLQTPAASCLGSLTSITSFKFSINSTEIG